MTALDKAKNQSPASEAGFFTVSDVIAPKVKKLSAKVNGDSASASWSATDETGIAKLELSLDNGAAIDVTPLGGYDLAGLAAGVHSLRLAAYDAAGNMAAKEIRCTVKEPKLPAMLAPAV